ncbi:autotransporter domain-containing protein [Haemophilus haemoglobinophilus]|nr:autotransporter domain-containing protein [Canicola haemoglobinophilus]
MSEKIGEVTIQAIPHDFSSVKILFDKEYESNDIWINGFPILLGDGKKLFIRYARFSEIASNGLLGRYKHALLSGNKFENLELLSTDGTFLMDANYSSISDDASVIADFDVYGNDRYFIKEGDIYKHKDFKIERADTVNLDHIIIRGVTGSGLVYGSIGEAGRSTFVSMFLYDPKTDEMKKIKSVEDWKVREIPQGTEKIPNLWVYEDGYNALNSTAHIVSSASYDGSVLTTIVNPRLELREDPSSIESQFFAAKSFYIYYGDNWQKNKRIILSEKQKVYYDEERGGSPTIVSDNGKVVAFAGRIYSGSDYENFTDLTKKVDNNPNIESKKYAVVAAMNKDGQIVGGGIGDGSKESMTIDMRPIIWYGNDWSKARDLGTLGGQDTDSGMVYSISDDGKVIAGMSTNAAGKYVPTIWRFINENTIPALIAPEKVNGDIENIGKETLKILQNQRYGLLSLLEGCRVEGGEGHYCLEQRSSLWGQKQDREAKVGVSMAYALTDNFSVGGIIEHSVYNNVFDKNKHRNLGLGLFAEWRDKQANKEFYIRPAISFSYHNGSLARPISVGTEYAYGKIKQKGTALSLTVGEQYSLAENTKFDWFAGIRYLDLKQKGYQDSAEYFPIQYNAMGYKEGSVFAGLGLKKGLTEKLSWLSKVELEQVIYQRNPEFYAYNEHLGAVSFKQKLAKNSLSVSTGLEYKLNDTFRISLIPGITKASAQPLRWNVGLYLTGQF